MDLPQPVSPTTAIYSPALILMLRSSRMSGMLSAYRKLTWFNSMLPLSLVTVCLPLAVSGSWSRIGFTISKVGRMPATISAILEICIKAPVTYPYAAVNAT